MPPSSPALSTQESVDNLTELVKSLHIKLDKFKCSCPPSSTVAPSTVSTLTPDRNHTYSSVVRALADAEKIKGKSQRAVLVGSTEKATPKETAAHDEKTLKEIVDVTQDKDLKKAYEAGQITHHRFPENKQPGRRIIKYTLPSTDLRDRLLLGLRTIGRPASFEPSMFVRRDFMAASLEQERFARDEARKRNIEANCLMWGVRDCELIKFRGPTFRPLQPHYRSPQDKKNINGNDVPSAPVATSTPTPSAAAAASDNVSTRTRSKTAEDKKNPLPFHSPNPDTVDSGGQKAKEERGPLIF